MAESLWEYWPTEGKNELSERNITAHLSSALWDSGFKLFAEAHRSQHTDRRVDLLAVHPESGTTVVVECKRLYNASQCAGMIDDIRRIRDFELRTRDFAGPSFGVLAATTWEEPIAQWWSSREAELPTSDARWSALSAELKGGHRGSVVLQGYREDEAVDRSPFHYFIYAVFSRG